MSVNLQKAKVVMLAREGTVKAERHAVFSANHPHQLAALQQADGFVINPFVKLAAPFVDLVKDALEGRLGGDIFAVLLQADKLVGFRANLVVAPLPVLAGFQHVNALLPALRIVGIEKLYLI